MSRRVGGVEDWEEDLFPVSSTLQPQLKIPIGTVAKTSWISLLEWTPLEPEERWRPSTLSFHPSSLSWVG